MDLILHPGPHPPPDPSIIGGPLDRGGRQLWVLQYFLPVEFPMQSFPFAVYANFLLR